MDYLHENCFLDTKYDNKDTKYDNNINIKEIIEIIL